MKKWIIATTALAAGISAHAGVIYGTDFTSGTYTDGALNSQDNWTADGPTTASGTGVSENGYKGGVNGTLNAKESAVISGATYTSKITFSFSDASDGSKSGPLLGATIYGGTDMTSPAINGTIKSMNDGSYRLGLYSNWGNLDTSIGFKQSSTFTAESIGLTHGTDLASDELTLSLAMTAGADINSWNATVTLLNGTTEVASWTPTATDLAFDTSTIYGGFLYGQSDSNLTVSDRIISSYELSSSIPEPGTFSMLGLGATGLLLLRRRRA